MAKVESFTLDHTAVKAPYVRLITVEEGPKGDKISNFDLRLVQPNENAIPTAGLHTIEHMLAGYLRDRLFSVRLSYRLPFNHVGRTRYCRSGQGFEGIASRHR